MKRILLCVLAVFVLLVAAAVIAVNRIDPAFVTKKIAEIGEHATGQPLVCEKVPSLSLFPLGLSLGRAHWGKAENNEGLTATIAGGLIELELIPLLSRRVVIKEVRLENPVLTIKPPQPDNKDDKKGSATGEGGAQKSPQEQDQKLPEDIPVELNRMVLHQAEIILDAGAAQRVHLKNLNLSVEDLRRHTDAALRCDFTFDIAQDKRKLVGTLALDTKIRYEAATLTFRQTGLTLTPISGLLPKEAGPVSFAADGVFAPREQNLRLTNARMTLPFNLNIQGDMEFSFGKPFSVKSKLQASVVLLDKYLNLLKEKPSPQPDAKPASGKAPPPAQAATPSSGKDMPTLDVSLTVAELRQGKLSLKDVVAEVRGSGGNYALNPLNCTLGSGGVIKSRADVNLSNETYAAQTTASGVRIGDLLDALGKGRPAEGVADLKANMTWRGASGKEIMATLTGDGILEARNVSVAALASVAKSTPGASALASPFQSIRVPFTARNGEITAQPITAVSKGVDAKGRALASLPKARLDATAVVQSLGLTLPVYARGPFSDLSFGLDSKAILPGILQPGDAFTKTDKNAGKGSKKTPQDAGGFVKGLLGR
ncbi:MAG: AsmA family protein [Desulfovibrio sp.]|jgi:AsmA protein|nr:AsmA family protein [Desulfovibrio sp.]